MEDIKEFEGLYAITKEGNIWSYPKYHICGYGQISNYKGRWLSPCNHPRGYKIVSLYKNKKCYKRLVHRLVLETFVPNIENKPFCNHKDCNPSNNNVDNLEWCTNRENIIHAYKNDLMNTVTEKFIKNIKEQGIKNQHYTLRTTRKFTMQQVKQIKESYQKLGIYARVGRLFNCSAKTVEKIVNNKSYIIAA